MAGVRNTVRPEHYPDLKARFERGESSTHVGKIYGVDHSTIIYHFKKMGLKRQPKETLKEKKAPRPVTGRGRFSPADHADMVARALKGETNREISTVYGCDPSLISHMMRSAGVKRPVATRECSVPGCTRAYQARGYCHTHYAYYQRNGMLSPTGERPVVTSTAYTIMRDARCDHTKSTCECIRRGKRSYTAYLAAAGIKRTIYSTQSDQILE